MSGEDTTPDGVLRQAKPHHLQPIPLLTAGGADDVMGVSVVISEAIGALGAVHDREVSQEMLNAPAL